MRRRGWFFIAPVFWIVVYVGVFTLVVRFSNGHWPQSVLERVPTLARQDPSLCEAERK